MNQCKDCKLKDAEIETLKKQILESEKRHFKDLQELNGMFDKIKAAHEEQSKSIQEIVGFHAAEKQMVIGGISHDA